MRFGFAGATTGASVGASVAGASVATGASVAGAAVGAGDPQAASVMERTSRKIQKNITSCEFHLFSFLIKKIFLNNG